MPLDGGPIGVVELRPNVSDICWQSGGGECQRRTGHDQDLGASVEQLEYVVQRRLFVACHHGVEPWQGAVEEPQERSSGPACPSPGEAHPDLVTSRSP